VALPDDRFWEDESAALAELLYDHLLAVAKAAGASGASDIGVPVNIDWTLVNKNVEKWARQMALDLVKGITETSRVYTTDAIAQWIESGESLGRLTAVLADSPYFGPMRSQMIAETEVTRAYAEGNRAAWAESGVVDGMRWFTAVDERVCPVCGPLHGKQDKLTGDFDGKGPPAHPRCRCWIQPVVNA
jgi:SPP1 gp7 family putative phage head morphogenesis protein